MLKIAIVTRYFPSSAEPWQGRGAYSTLRLLVEKAELQVFYPNAAYPRLLRPRSRIYDALDPSYSPAGVKASYFDFPALPLLSRPINGWMAARVLLPHVREFAPDLIYSYFLYPDAYAGLQIGKALSVPTVAMSIGSDLNNITGWLPKMHTRTVLRESDFVLTKSGDLRRKAIAMGASPDKSRVVRNGCDSSMFHIGNRVEARRQLKIDPAAEVVAYVGRMDVRKGLRELVQSVVSLHAQRPKLQLYLIGEGPDKPAIEEAVAAFDAASYIHPLGSCALSDVALWMTASDLVTLPSYMEGCPNVVLEALACGRPVVATNVGGIPEILNDKCGRLVPPREPDALAHALASVLDASWDAAAISAHWSRSWSTVADELLDVFESVLSNRSAELVPGHKANA
jgi:glycosyltransferase involved in cell wall biosynthesis